MVKGQVEKALVSSALLRQKKFIYTGPAIRQAIPFMSLVLFGSFFEYFHVCWHALRSLGGVQSSRERVFGERTQSTRREKGEYLRGRTRRAAEGEVKKHLENPPEAHVRERSPRELKESTAQRGSLRERTMREHGGRKLPEITVREYS